MKRRRSASGRLEETMWCSTIGVAMVTLILSIFVAPLVTLAQPTGHVHRIGWLSPGFPRPDRDPPVDAFRQGLRDLGYIEGQNLVIVYRGAEGQDERLPALAAELVGLPVEVLVAVGTAATRAAQNATHTIPIVMTGTPDPVAQGLVASLARPGGNITGVSLMMAELPGKRLQLLRETVPQNARVAVLVNPASVTYKARMGQPDHGRPSAGPAPARRGGPQCGRAGHCLRGDDSRGCRRTYGAVGPGADGYSVQPSGRPRRYQAAARDV
jgi:ABC transporter substrate binding protein